MGSGDRRTSIDRIVSKLVPLIYEAAVDPALWPEFLRQFNEAIGSAGAALFFQDHDSSQGHIAASHGYDPHYQRQYQEHFASVNVWLKRMADQTKSGDIRNSLSACSGSELVRTEYYNDWLRPQDLFYGYGGTILRQGSVTTNITAMRPRRTGSFGDAETRILELLMPHLQRAVQLHHRLATLEAQRSASLEALDHLAAGVVLVNAHAQVLFLNRAAQQIVDGNDGLSAGLHGLSAAHAAETNELRRSIAECGMLASGLALAVSRGVMHISRPSARRPFSLLIIPLCLEFARRQLLTAGQIPSAIILISDPEADPALDPSALQHAFGLTPAEARFALVMISGKSVGEAADHLGVTLNTARTHLKRVLSKTGARRQGELIHLLLKSFGTFRAR